MECIVSGPNRSRTEARLVKSGPNGILISDGLARPYVCGQTGCPRRQSWCNWPRRVASSD